MHVGPKQEMHIYAFSKDHVVYKKIQAVFEKI